MNRRFSLFVAGLAFALMGGLITAYIWAFGVSPSHEQSVWGAFGDYFGGILNPVFALFAFLGVLWSLGLQMKQFNQLAMDKQADEILQVVKDIDARLGALQMTSVGETSGVELHILHMVAEAERGAKRAGDSPAYTDFLRISNEPGAVIESAVREIVLQISTMVEFLERYPQQARGGYAPIIEYYITKASRLLPMLEDLGSLSGHTRIFFFKLKRNRPRE